MKRISPYFASATTVCASVSYVTTVENYAAFKFVVPSAVFGSLIMILLSRVSARRAFFTSLVMTSIWSIFVNIVSGNTSGPVARTAAVCGFATVFAMLGAAIGRADVFVTGIGLVLSGASYYGAEGETRPVVIASAALVLTTIPIIVAEAQRRTFKKFVLLVIASLTMVITVILLGLSLLLTAFGPIFSDDARVESPIALTEPTIHGKLNLGMISTRNPPPDSANNSRWLLIFLLLVTLLLILATATRIMLVRFKRLQWKASLERLDHRNSVAASWSWLTYHLRCLRWDLSEPWSIENFEDWPHLKHFSGEDLYRVAEYSDLVKKASFMKSEIGPNEQEFSWILSDFLIDKFRAQTSWWRRFSSNFVKVVA
jgi:hypothetical protein